jgi:hypothetical protein
VTALDRIAEQRKRDEAREAQRKAAEKGTGR